MNRVPSLVVVSTSILACVGWLCCQESIRAQQLRPDTVPGAITLSYEGPLTTSPPLDPGLTFGYNIVITVKDGADIPVPNVTVTQTMRTNPLSPVNTHEAQPTGGTWGNDFVKVTDAQGQVRDLCQYQSRQQAMGMATHSYKHDTCTVQGNNLSKYYWNPKPYPSCSAAHTDEYDTVMF
jgi:hypothetical protein